jgi:hypothetical protein
MSRINITKSRLVICKDLAVDQKRAIISLCLKNGACRLRSVDMSNPLERGNNG